jgi:adenylate cyclase class 2
MSQIEREIKILKVNVESVKEKLKENGIVSKGKFIQDVYTFDLPTVDEFYIRYLNDLILNNDKRGIKKLIKEIKTCFSKDDILLVKNVIGVEDILEFIENNNNDFSLLKNDSLVELMKRTNDNFSKWIRLRQTGDETTITIKKIFNSKGEYELDAVEELEFNVPNIEDGKHFLEDLGYFFARHQTKMRIAYDYKNTEIVIDKWPQIEPYIEIEGPSKEEIDDAVLMLGYTLKDALVINTDDVYLREGINLYDDEHKNLSFSEKEMQEVEKYLK